MIDKILKDVITIGAIVAGLALFLANRDVILERVNLRPTPLPVETAIETEPAIRKSGSVVSIPKSPADGQFWTQARVNSGTVKFLVDTGAGAVALTLNDAKKAGIKPRDLVYDVTVQTAAGNNKAARVTLKSISIGGIALRNVEALVIHDGLHVSLLGMTFLGQLQKMEATQSALILRL